MFPCAGSHSLQRQRCLQSRRKVVAMLSAIGASAALGLRQATAQTVAVEPWMIDTHHHIYPPR
jgi:hypothetical protein